MILKHQIGYLAQRGEDGEQSRKASRRRRRCHTEPKVAHTETQKESAAYISNSI